jgi:hypothetical protein
MLALQPEKSEKILPRPGFEHLSALLRSDQGKKYQLPAKLPLSVQAQALPRKQDRPQEAGLL